MNNQPFDYEYLSLWYKTLLRPPPIDTWFTVRMDGGEMRPAFITGGNCITVQMKESRDGLTVILVSPLPPEWRP